MKEVTKLELFVHLMTRSSYFDVIVEDLWDFMNVEFVDAVNTAQMVLQAMPRKL